MKLYDTWRNMAEMQTTPEMQAAYWNEYFAAETENYIMILANKDHVYEGTMEELAKEFGMETVVFCGFMDGINESLVEPNPIETMEEDTEVNLGFDKVLLYKNMVDAKADWLYGLEEWKTIFDEKTRKELYLEAKKMNTIVRPKKIGRNDPCPCGSGKKYKFCHGRTPELQKELEELLAARGE